jgi:hypothetical protein
MTSSTYGRTAGALAITAALILTGAACGDDDGNGGNGGKGGDITSMPTSIPSAPGSPGSDAKDAFESASASATAKLGEIRDGLDAKSDASIGRTETDGDRTKAEITIDNKTDKTADYTLSVDFRGADGKLVDVAVLNVDNVGAGQQAKATARSHRKLTGTVTAEIGRVLRH